MSDFLTRLVDRQAGTMAMVQPRTPSMFAPKGSRAESSDLPVMASLSQVDEAPRTPPASIREGDHPGKVPTQIDQQEGRPPVPGSRSTRRATLGARHDESSPAPLVRNGPVVVPQPAHEVFTTPHVSPVTIHNQASDRQAGRTEQHITGRVGPVPVPPPAGIEPPPRLLETHRDLRRSSAAAPPSLVQGMVTDRRAEQGQAASNQPAVQVTIGRIEVTAISTAPEAKQKPASRRPAMSLEDYLSRRQGGRK